ncbi:MAG: hypothetical protein IJW82_06735 [Clostridia bacterium]|nr:hypothetical protein [Clostridia bacterium]
MAKSSSKKTTQSDAEKSLKKLWKKIPKTVKIIALVLFVLGNTIGGFFGHIICKNDTFELLPYESKFLVGCEATIDVPGVKIISYGKDVSDNVNTELSEGLKQNQDGTITIEDTSVEGVYYIIYTTDNFKFSKIKKIRYIYVNNMEDVGESVSDGGVESASVKIDNNQKEVTNG